MVRALVVAKTEKPFLLETDFPVRFSLLRHSTHEHFLLTVAHHIACDGASLRVFVQELTRLYQAYVAGKGTPLNELTSQYSDFAIWQSEWLKTRTAEQQLEYWRTQLDGVTPLELPADHPRPAVMSHRGGAKAFLIGSALTDALKELGQRNSATLFMTVLGAFQILLSKYAGQDDVIVGTPVANRNSETEDLVGFFVNTLVMRTQVTGDLTLAQLLERVRQVALEAYQHQDMPFEKVVEELQPERDLSRSPLFQVALAMQPKMEQSLEVGDVFFDFPEFNSEIVKFDLELRVAETLSGLRCCFGYNADIFEGSTIGNMVGHYLRVLEEMVRDPEQRIGELCLLGEEEKQQVLVEWNRTEREYPSRTIHELFASQAGRTPEAIAVVCGGEKLSYEELNARANQLGHYLRQQGVGPEVRVAVCLERSVEMVAALLAVLKAGGAYVPLDPAYPEERLRFMVEDSEAAVLLTESRFAATVREHCNQSAGDR